MAVVPRHSWLGPAAGFGGVGRLSSLRGEGPLKAVSRHSWLGLAAGFVRGSLANTGPVGGVPLLAWLEVGR